jgi:tetratricopeptide (TPR) repeat protein
MLTSMQGIYDDHSRAREEPVELIVLSTKGNSARCRSIESGEAVTLRAGSPGDVVPGEIVAVTPEKQWRYAGRPCLSGAIESLRIDAAALGLAPLGLEDCGTWNPDEHYWGEENEPIPDWAKPIIAYGSRQEFEMEQVLPGADSGDFDSDPIGESVDLLEAGDRAGARVLLMGLCEADLRCLDAHAHLGNLLFDRVPRLAIRHYEVGLRIGELSLGPGFNGLLPWGFIDNRPFLRCIHSYGLCLWRLGRLEEAQRVFERMLWLNPADNQGIRLLTGDLSDGRPWQHRTEW